MIYLDNAASTQIDQRVLEAMMPYLTEQYGNPGSLYKLGRDAHDAVEKAREQVAKFMGAKPEQIIFTSGATEANNMVFSLCEPLLEKSGKRHIITSAIEHQSVLKSVHRLTNKPGFAASYLGAGYNIHPFPDDFNGEIREDTGLVSIMYVNNEIGYAYDVALIGKMCQEFGVLFHTDCVQAAGYRSINVGNIGCDFAAISSHKIHGPKGVGALFIKDKEKFEPMICGGDHQEFGMRGGTENVAGIVGFGKACELAMENLSVEEAYRMERMKFKFIKGFSEQLEHLKSAMTKLRPRVELEQARITRDAWYEQVNDYSLETQIHTEPGTPEFRAQCEEVIALIHMLPRLENANFDFGARRKSSFYVTRMVLYVQMVKRGKLPSLLSTELGNYLELSLGTCPSKKSRIAFGKWVESSLKSAGVSGANLYYTRKDYASFELEPFIYDFSTAIRITDPELESKMIG